MKLPFILSFILLMSAGNSVAQNIIQMQEKPLDVPGANFAAVEVIDARPDTTLIGIQEFGFALQKKQPHVLRGNVTALNEFLKRNLPLKIGGDSVVIKINRLAVDEKLAYTQFGKRMIAKSKANFSVYLKKEGKFHLLQTKDYSEEDIGMGIGNKHAENIARLLRQCLIEATSSSRDIATKEVLTKEEVWAPALPAIMTGSPKKGLYATIDEFRNNQPSHPEITIEDSNDQTQPFIITIEDHGKKVKISPDDSFWGFSDGENVFLKQSGYYFDVEISSTSVGFIGFDYVSMVRKKAIGPLLAGAVLAGAFNGGALSSRSTTGFFLSSISRTTNKMIMNVAVDVAKASASKEVAENIHNFRIFMDDGKFIQTNEIK